MERILIVHGGAGNIPDNRVEAKYEGMKMAIRIGYKILLDEDDALTAVERAVNAMENLPAFNAGYGSVLTETGEVEMDAIIINGSTLEAGSVGAVRHIPNPISLSRLIMERTPHVLLVGKMAEDWAESQGIQLVPTRCLIPPTKGASKCISKDEKITETGYDVGTVGAVAINSKGQIAVATSTGGLAGKLNGRVGDTPIIGGGTFADDEIAGISATGFGEAIARSNLTSRISHLIQNGMNPRDAGKKALEYMKQKIKGSDGGVIIISSTGQIGCTHNSIRMSWSYVREDRIIHYGINSNEDKQEPLGNEPVPFPIPPNPQC